MNGVKSIKSWKVTFKVTYLKNIHHAIKTMKTEDNVQPQQYSTFFCYFTSFGSCTERDKLWIENCLVGGRLVGGIVSQQVALLLQLHIQC